MSAIAWEPAEAPAPLPRGARPGRPNLVLVEGGASATGAASSGDLRMTARGRLVLVVLAVLVVAAVLGVRGVGGAGAAPAEMSVVVAEGQTLSEIATAQLPELSISEGVLAIQLANDLSTAQINAGQELVIPRG